MSTGNLSRDRNRSSLLARAGRTALQGIAILALTLVAGEAAARLFGVRPLTSAALLRTDPPRWLTSREPWGNAVREAVGLPDLGLHPRLEARIPEGVSPLVPGDPHWTELGHRVHGEVLAEWLDESGLLDPPRRTPASD